MEKMIDLNVDMIITNYPNVLKEVLESKTNKYNKDLLIYFYIFLRNGILTMVDEITKEGVERDEK